MRIGYDISEREGVLPWYKGEGRERENTSFSGVHTVIRTFPNSLNAWVYLKVVSTIVLLGDHFYTRVICNDYLALVFLVSFCSFSYS